MKKNYEDYILVWLKYVYKEWVKCMFKVNDSFYGNIFVMLGVLSGRLDLGLVMLWGCYWNFIEEICKWK